MSQHQLIFNHDCTEFGIASEHVARFATERNYLLHIDDGFFIRTEKPLEAVLSDVQMALEGRAVIRVYNEPDGTDDVQVLIESLTQRYLWYCCVSKTADSYHFFALAYAGEETPLNAIVQSLHSHNIPEPAKEGEYHIVVTEYTTRQAQNGVRNIHSTNHRISTLKHLRNLNEFLYPDLSVQKMAECLLSTRENIFMLYGDFGTGKTCLMKLLLRKTAEILDSNFQALYVKDAEVIRRPEFWSTLSEMVTHQCPMDRKHGAAAHGGPIYLILDDLDNELGKREKGKDSLVVSQLLSFSDGLFENYLKVIITTNMPITDIDTALIRPGRCFDVLHLRQLPYDIAGQIWVNDLGLTKESFVASFPPGSSDSISQAALMSECNRIKDASSSKAYLLNPDVSIRSSIIQNRKLSESQKKGVGWLST